MISKLDKRSSSEKLLLLTKQIEEDPHGGRELLSKLNYQVLHEIYGDGFLSYELPINSLSGFFSYLNAFFGHIDGLDAVVMHSVFSIIQRQGVTKVFVDGSNLGGFVAELKTRFPKVEVTTFFHNVEARFFWGSFLASKNARTLAVLLVNFLAERKAVHHSDKIVCLSERDSLLLKKLYGQKATHISSMALGDKCPCVFINTPAVQPEPFALFVGGTFYANQIGISWFVREVSPKIDLPVYIVGRGFENYRAELDMPGKVFVIGEVDELADWYQRAKFVIAPIFDGSGMKTKVAEALMYGKKVVGTHEAFSGYEGVVDEAGWVCETVDDFVEAIRVASKEVTQSFDPSLRVMYENHYSYDAAVKRFRGILS